MKNAPRKKLQRQQKVLGLSQNLDEKICLFYLTLSSLYLPLLHIFSPCSFPFLHLFPQVKSADITLLPPKEGYVILPELAVCDIQCS
jgi:hypothetical protein